MIYYKIHKFCSCFCFFFNDTATTEIYTLSLHDALPIAEVKKNACSPAQLDFGASDVCPRERKPDWSSGATVCNGGRRAWTLTRDLGAGTAARTGPGGGGTAAASLSSDG